MAKRGKTLSEQLIALTNPEPTSFDELDEEHEGLSARLVSRNDVESETLDVQYFESGAIGRRAAAFIEDEDSRYAGRVTSRHKMSDEWDLDDSVKDVSTRGRARVEESFGESTESDENESARSSDSEKNEDYAEGSEEDGDLDDELPGGEAVSDDVRPFSEQNVKEEMEKGQAVKSQLKLWDCFLEARIKLQSILGISNCFPQQDSWSAFQLNGGPELTKQLQRSQARLRTLLDSLLSLQQQLLEENKEASPAASDIKHKENTVVDTDEEISSDLDEEQLQNSEMNGGVSDECPSESDDDVDNEKEGEGAVGKSRENARSKERKRTRHQAWSLPRGVSYSQHTAKVRKFFNEYRDSVVTKWDEKLRIATGKFSSKSFLSKDHSTLNRVGQILNDRQRLVKRTQLRRSTCHVLGKADEVASEERDAHLRDYDSEIFNDDDFYHQLLKELIERRASHADDPVAMSRQWLEVQKVRSKVRKRVDTKASKGRRIRFDVHPKLQSFMAPAERGSMPDLSRNDLYSSLFGQQPVQSSVNSTL